MAGKKCAARLLLKSIDDPPGVPTMVTDWRNMIGIYTDNNGYPLVN